MPEWTFARLDDGSMTIDAHEDSLQQHMEKMLPPGGTFIDIGAHIGLWTVRFGQRAGKIVAIEPNPASVVVLRENIRLNDLTDKTTVLEIAAWDTNEPLDLFNPTQVLDPNARTVSQIAGWMRVLSSESENGEGKVQGRRLDEVLPDLGLGQIDLVKVDTEGADIRALRGMIETIAQYRPGLFIESHHMRPYYYYTIEDLQDFIASIGYEYTNVTWASQFHFICVPKP